MFFLCRLNFHLFEDVFVPYSDQPFEGDFECVTEGYHTRKCIKCDIERDRQISGVFYNLPFIRKHEKIYSELSYETRNFVFHVFQVKKYPYLKDVLKNDKGEGYIERIALAQFFFFIPIYLFSPYKIKKTK